jgi:hypothetical protein
LCCRRAISRRASGIHLRAVRLGHCRPRRCAPAQAKSRDARLGIRHRIHRVKSKQSGRPPSPESSRECGTAHVNRLVNVTGMTMLERAGERVLVDSSGEEVPLMPAHSCRDRLIAQAPGNWLVLTHVLVNECGKSGDTSGWEGLAQPRRLTRDRHSMTRLVLPLARHRNVVILRTPGVHLPGLWRDDHPRRRCKWPTLPRVRGWRRVLRQRHPR